MEDTALANITAAERSLALVTDPTDAANVADIAAAAAVYAKRHKAAIPVINRALDIKHKAERKAGQLLREMEMNSASKRESNKVLLSDLGITKMQSSRWQQAASVPEETYQEYIRRCNEQGKEATSSGLYKLAPKLEKNGAKKAEPIDGIYTDLSQLSGKKFGCIYADPPWRYDNQGTRASTDNHYETMSVEDICALPIGDLSADRAHLHLWTTNAFLFECPKIFEAWGFEYRSTFVWVKPQMGIGNYWRNSHELLLTARKGGQVSLSKREKSWIECPRGRHSAKPQQVRESIERLSPGPFLELFGRRAIPGWAVFGNQVIQELV